MPSAIDGNFEAFRDQRTELTSMLYRQNVVESIISDKKLKLFEENKQKAQERFEYKPFEVGQEIFTFIDEPPAGTVRKQFIPWDGPFKILEVRDMNLVIDR